MVDLICRHMLTFHKSDAITEQSARSGFDVANRDLEIRGAGSLLETEQSGMAAKVGFDLFMRMVKKYIRQLRGLDIPMGGEGSIEWDENKDINNASESSYLI